MNLYSSYVEKLSYQPPYRIFPFIDRKKNIEHEFTSSLLNYNELQKNIYNESSPKVFNYISEHLDLSRYCKNIIFSTSSKTYLEDTDLNNVRAIINFKEINKIQNINDHFISVNKLLPDAGIFIGRLETYALRKLRLYKSYGRFFGRILYLSDFLINRVTPRVAFLSKLYFFLTHGRKHVIGLAETLGRLVFCGFDIIEFKEVNGRMYFVVMKINEPIKGLTPSYGPLIRLPRIGQHGKTIGVYKLRTMRPYSEFLQSYILRLNGYNELGKPSRDYRVAKWGKIMRRLWLDEIPQIINVLKGEMKIVGVRPLSQVRFDELPEDVQRERIKFKPGCIPPYVSLNMPDDEGNIEAERIYLTEKKKRPVYTDIKFFLLGIKNIFLMKLRSA